MARTKRSHGVRNNRLRHRIHSRRLTAAKKTEDAWEAEKAAPIREMVKDTLEAGVSLSVVMADLLKLQQKAWPLKSRIGKRKIGIWGITKEMRSRSRRHLNDIVVAD